MVRILLEENAKEATYTVVTTGHATGSAACCAAISALVQSLDTWLHYAGAEIRQEIVKHGATVLIFSGEGADVAFQVVKLGLLRLESTYPELISSEIFEV